MEYVERKRIMFFGLPWTFTKYHISDEMITIKKGFLTVVEDDAYMYKVQDVKLSKTLGERIFGLSTIICYTGDITDPELRLTHIKHGAEIKDFLLKASEESRRKRRTMHSMNVGYDEDGNAEDIGDIN